MAEAQNVVIVGVGCRFPGANNVNEYWQLLKNGENHVIEVPPDRWNIEHFYDADPNAPGKMYVRQGGFIPGVEEWDNRFFGVSDEEARMMDPQQQLVLQCVHMALEDGGITREDLQKGKTGVYIGSMTYDYYAQTNEDPTLAVPYSVTGNHFSIISARVAYNYNLTGPALTIDTACSSSLVAINMASQALVQGDCDMAICGGVNCLLEPNVFIALCKARMLSPNGQCRTFTNQADGYARGEGCGIVILKRMDKAIEQKNKIWGLIQSGTNQDGQNAQPISAPSGLQQERLIEEIFTKHKLDRNRIQVIEAHGTGTAIGDPTECGALGRVLGSKKHKKYLGSVKTNIGHLEAAAGVAGLIKVLLMMKHKTIVPSLWYSKENENPKLKLNENGFTVPTKCMPWNVAEHEKRQACVNSFGFGGTNAHAVVSEVSVCRPFSSSPLPAFVVLSAQDEDLLSVNIATFTERLKSEEYDLRSLSFTSTCKRDFWPVREAYFADNHTSLIEQLSNRHSSKLFAANTQVQPKLVFVCCGVGTVWQGMGKNLLEIDVFLSTIKNIDSFLKPLTGWSMLSKIKECSQDIVTDPCVSHIAIFTYQIALAEMWKSFGITPDAVVGQSVGEVAAAYIGGYLDLPSAVKVIYYRSHHLASVNAGTMLVVRNVKIENVIQFCKTNWDFEIAVYISPMACTVACEKDTKQIYTHASMHWNGSQVIPLTVPCAYHSRHVKTVAIKVSQSLSGLQNGHQNIPMISTVTCQLLTKQSACSGDYWKQNVRRPVKFGAAVANSTEVNVPTIFLEIGPSPVLKAHLKDIFTESSNVMCIPSISRNDEAHTLAQAVCQLFNNGVNVKWNSFIPSSDTLTDIPIQVLQKNTNLQLTRSVKTVHRTQGKCQKNDIHPYVKQNERSGYAWDIDLNRPETNFLFEHRVQNQIIVPGALYTEVGFVVANACLTDVKSINEVELSLEFVRKVKLERDNRTVLSVLLKDQEADQFSFQVRNEQDVTCKGWVKTVRDERVQPYVDIDREKHWFMRTNVAYMTKLEIYNHLKEFGFEYGENFQLLTSSFTTKTRGMLHVTATDEVLRQAKGQCFHPCLIDVMLQATITITADEMRQTFKQENLLFLPVALGTVRVYKQPEKHMVIFAEIITKTVLETVYQLHYDIVMVDKRGNKVAEILNYTTYSRRQSASAPCELRYEVQWCAHSEQRHFRKAISNKELIVLFMGTNWEKKTRKLLQGKGYTCIDLDSAGSTETYLENIQTGVHQAVIFYVGGLATSKEITAKKAYSHLKSCVENCLHVTSFVKFSDNNETPLPLYIVTENTQTTSTSGTTGEINLNGSELWGFVRSLNMESKRIYVSMVDTQPSFTSTFEMLMKFVKQTFHNENEGGHDAIVTPTQILRARFCRTRRERQTPDVRNEHMLLPIQNEALTLMASEHGMYLTGPHARVSNGHDVTLQVYSTVTPPMFRSISKQLIEDSMSRTSSVFGIEHLGITVNGNEKPEFVVAVYPSSVKTILDVPSACCVKKKDLKYHKPGLLTHVIALTELASRTAGCSSVAILCKTREDYIHGLLKTLIKYKTGLNASILKHLTAKSRYDCVIAVEPLDCHLVMVPAMCKQFTCFTNNMTASERVDLLVHQDLRVNHVSFEEIFSLKEIGTQLHAAVAWINKHHAILSELQLNGVFHTSMTPSDLDCSEILLVDDKTKTFRMPVRYPKEHLFFRNAVYVVTGGLTGLGWEITKYLAENGAGNIALITRRSASDQQKYEIENINNTFGCKVFSVEGDVTDIASLQGAFKTINKFTNSVPVRGIFHGAGVIDARPLIKIDKANIEVILKPKVLGTLHLHMVTMGMHLDYFVAASSVSSFIGMPGQSSYGAANCFMDAFMVWRRRNGLSGQSINWGALAVGMATQPMFVDNFHKRGYNLVSIPELRACFHEALLQNSTGTVYCDINWELASRDFLSLPKINLDMKTLIYEESPTALSATKYKHSRFAKASFINLKSIEQQDKIQEFVLEIARRAIGGSAAGIDMNDSFLQQGFDSISRLQFTNVVQDVFGLRIPESELLADVNTINKVVLYLHKKLFG